MKKEVEITIYSLYIHGEEELRNGDSFKVDAYIDRLDGAAEALRAAGLDAEADYADKLHEKLLWADYEKNGVAA